MIGMQKLLPRGRKSKAVTRSGGFQRRSASIRLGACSLLVILLGIVLFAWIGRVNDSQREAQAASLRRSISLVIADLQEQILLLLATFNPDADLDASGRLEAYSKHYRWWRQLSMDGALVERVLFLDLRVPKSKALAELKLEPFRIELATWDKDLVGVREHIYKFGFRSDQSIKRSGLATWMLHPRPLVVYRPIGVPRRDPGHTAQVATVTGYLILQLNLDRIRERLLPKVLDAHFGNLTSGARYEVTVALDGRSLADFQPLSAKEAVRDPDVADTPGYALQSAPLPSKGRPPEESPARAYPFLLSSDSIPGPVSRGGGIQRVVLRGSVENVRSIVSDGSPPGLGADSVLGHAKPVVGLATSLVPSVGFPRLFLVSERPHQLTIEARRVEGTFDDALSSEQLRWVAMGLLVLLVLTGSMAMVAVRGTGAAQQAQARVEAVASQTHQLRTALAAITLLADNLASGKIQRADGVVKYAGLIRQYGHQLHDVVDRTLKLSAQDPITRRYSLTQVDVSEEARDALEQVAPILDTAGFTTERSLAEDLSPVWADAVVLRQCLGELLNNAAKYGLPGRWVKVETCESGSGRGREVQIRVHDRGQGVPRRKTRKIFQPHYRVADTASSSIPGAGLGLPLVRQDVRAMGGKVTVTDGEGGGSVFTIHLPLADSSGGAKPQPPQQPL